MERRERILLENSKQTKESAVALIEELALSDMELNLSDETVMALLWGLDTVRFNKIIWCRECKFKDTSVCPSYDTPMKRSSLRVKFCSVGELDKTL